MIERVYTVNLSKLYAMGRHTERARKAIKMLRRFASRHMKTDDEKIIITQEVNEYVWRNGIQKPPKKLKLKLMKDKDGTVMVSLESEIADGKEKVKATKKNKVKEQKPAAEKKKVEKEKVNNKNTKGKAKKRAATKADKVQSKNDKT